MHYLLKILQGKKWELHDQIFLKVGGDIFLYDKNMTCNSW